MPAFFINTRNYSNKNSPKTSNINYYIKAYNVF